MTKFDSMIVKSVDDVETTIRHCKERGHIQQVVYSVHHLRLTQICFGCKHIVYNLGINA